MASKAKNLFKLRKECYATLKCDLSVIKAGESICPVDILKGVEKKMTMLLFNWENDYYMAIACLAALRSKDPRKPVGACIVDTRGEVVGVGYNAMPYVRGGNNDNSFSWDRIQKRDFVCHAAVNAIASRTIPDLTDCTMYVTLLPDRDCAHAIAKSGIKEVKCLHKHKPEEESTARSIFSLYGRVSIKVLDLKTEVQCLITRDGMNKSLSLNARLTKAANEAATSRRASFDLTLTWDEFFMGLAKLQCVYCNDNDRDPEKRVGACIVNDFKQVLAIGRSSTENPDTLGFTSAPQPSAPQPEHEDSFAQHAEYNAIVFYNGKETLRDCTLYVTTAPCSMCAKLIAQSGIKKMVYIVENKKYPEGIKLLETCNIHTSKSTHTGIIDVTITEVTQTNPSPDPLPLYCWPNNTRCFNCTKENGIKIPTIGKTPQCWTWKFEAIDSAGLFKDKEILLHSGNVFCHNKAGNVPSKLKIYIFRAKDSYVSLSDPNKAAHFYIPYPAVKVDTNIILCKITDVSDNIFENFTICFNVQGRG